MTPADPRYWAAESQDKICGAIVKRTDHYYEWLRSSGRLNLWWRVHKAYFAGLVEGGAMGTDGDQEELISLGVNDLRNLTQHLMVMTTGQRPAFEPRAVNSDHRSQTQTILASGILDYVMKEKKLERIAKEALENALLFGDGFGVSDWNATGGTDYAVDDTVEPPQSIKTGDLAFYACGPLDVVRDFTKVRQDGHQWYSLRKWKNRYDLAAKYPQLEDRIIGLPTRTDPIKRPRFVNLYRYDTDDVEVWHFYHERCDSLPDGRHVIFCEPDILLFDGPLPFRNLPVRTLSCGNMLGTSHGYTSIYDLMPLQEATNALYSSIASNQAAFGVQNIATPKGSDLDVADLGGLKIIHYDAKFGKPEGLNLTSTPPEIFTFLGLVRQASEMLSGINAVRRGDPAQALGKNASGSAMALLDAKALEFQSGLQQAWVDFLEDMGTDVLYIYRDFAKAPQVAMLVGSANRPYLREFTGDDLDRIDRVSVELGNPLARTTSGRAQIAQDLLANGLIKTPEEYIQVITTGRLDPAIEGTQKELLTVKEENEALADGSQPVVALATQNHPLHIREHAAAIGSPSSQTDPQAVSRSLAHIQEHADLWKGTDPTILMAMGVPPPPMMAPPPGPGGTSEATGPLPPGGPGVPPDGQPRMPQMPVNPQSGDRAPPPPSPVSA